MGVTTEVFGLSPLEKAVPLGDYGFMGDLDFNKTNKSKTNFKSIYNGLSSIGLITYELECFYQFLRKHHDTPIYIFNDDAVFICNDNSRDYPEDMETYNEKVWIPDGYSLDDFNNALTFKLTESDFVKGYYELESEAYGESFRSELNKFKPFDEWVLSEYEIDDAEDYVFGIEDYLFYSMYSIYNPHDNLGAIKEFISQYKSEEITVRLVPAW